MTAPKTKWCDRTVSTGPFYCLVLSQEQYNRELKRMGIPIGEYKFVEQDCRGQMNKLTSKKGNTVCVVGLDQSLHKTGIDVACTLVHEAVHIWQYHCEYTGEATPGIEQEAYAIEHIAKELMLSYIKQTGSDKVV